MKKLFGILGTVAGAGLLGLGICNLVKKGKGTDEDAYDYDGETEETEVDGEYDPEEE